MTIQDDQLQRLLRTALPPIDSSAPPRDLWFELNGRLESRPRWSLFDTALAAGIAVTLLLIPETLFLIALHL